MIVRESNMKIIPQAYPVVSNTFVNIEILHVSFNTFFYFHLEVGDCFPN